MFSVTCVRVVFCVTYERTPIRDDFIIFKGLELVMSKVSETSSNTHHV